MHPFFYPVNDYGPLMPGLVIGGLLMCYFQILAMTGRSPGARRFLDSYFKFLVLLSFVLGALSGVGTWFTSIQVSPRTIGLMIDEFHWLWAIEWTFFCLEVVAGYAFYRYGKGLNDRARLALLVLYSLAAWASLFWINSILSWQLTPGEWVESHSLWAGFFNPGFWPSLLYRTVASLTVAALVTMVVVNTFTDFSREQKTELINRAAWLLAPMALMPLLGLWYLAAMPADSRSWVTGGSVAMMLFFVLTVLASAGVAVYALAGLIRQHLYINGMTAALLVALAFAATGGGEFVREGARKPYTVREVLYSNSVRPNEVAELRRQGCVTRDPYPLTNAAELPCEQVRLKAKVFRFQCSACHTTDGSNGLRHLTATWTTPQKRMLIAQLQRTKAFMPPFAGTPDELEALVQFVEWHNAGRPMNWPDRPLCNEDRTAIARWLGEDCTRCTPRRPGSAGWAGSCSSSPSTPS